MIGQGAENFLRSLQPQDFAGRDLSKEEFEEMFKMAGAFWVYEGSPSPDKPHAKLTSGKCSDGYINCPQALVYANVAMIMAQQMVRVLEGKYSGPTDWAIGSATAATSLAECCAVLTGAKSWPLEKGPDKEQIWPDRHKIGPREVVVQCEELMTTALTTGRVRDGIAKAHDYEVQYGPVVVLAHRSDEMKVGGSRVLACFHYDINTWAPSECPLCEVGSEPIPPKGENWARLTGQAA